jgi:amidohydrolase family protein
MWVADGRFVTAPSTAADSVVDLRGAFVVPPFAEGHNHWLEPGAVTAYVQSYLRDGVFYVQDQANAPSIRTRIASAVNSPISVDYVSANQGWTGPGAHPLQIGLQFVKFGSFPSTWTEADLDRNLVMVVRDSSDIAARWNEFLRGRPDFAKLFLLYSEQHGRRSADSAYRFRRGLDPRLAPEIAQRAHAAGLRVSAHIYTAADFRTAVAAGVDVIAHFPGSGYEPELGPGAFRITDADARRAADAHVVVMTTLHWLEEQEDTVQNAMLLREVVRPNWSLLRRHGVPILIGSDEFRATPIHEASVLVRAGLMTPLEAIQSLSVLTPQAIFPTRRIGVLEPGYEASFLALAKNPVDDFRDVGTITMRVKQGVVLELTEPPPAFPSLGG